MGSEIGADITLDYVTFQILPENRYGASIRSKEKEEMVKDGPLELLLEHLPSIKDQIIEGSCDNFKLELPNSVTSREWFTKSTLMRFLDVIGSSDALKKSVAISNEMSQLEETRKFHLSLYTQADKMSGSDNSKNELLRAMDSRIAVLTEELVLTFNVAAGGAFSFQEMIGLREFCQHFGDLDIRNLLVKLSEKSKKTPTITPATNKKSPIPLISKNDYVNKITKNLQTSRDSNSSKPVQFDASPAKAAEIERQSSTESDDESSNSSEDERPSPVERSRTLIRSASPRRSASPMRKVQIGRSGSRRTPALTIKSLPYFPARERISSFRDPGNDLNNEESEEPNRKPEINVTRMSVQDAISLFESRQRDQINEGQKKVGVENSTNTNKAVLRRWSSGMSESQKSMNIVDPTTSENNAEDKDEHAQMNLEIKEGDFRAFENQRFEETVKTDMGLEGTKDFAKSLSENVEIVNQTEENCEILDSAEWTRQKEEELNKMLMKFAEYNLSNIKNTSPDNKKTKQVSRMGQSGIVNGQLREKRDVKSTGEKTVKKVEKQSGIRPPKQRISDKPKAEKSSPKINDSVKKVSASRTSSINKSGPPSNTKKESLKPSLPKKGPSKTSPLPATRKSWPSTPSPRISGTLPTRSPTITPTSITSAPRQKSQSPAPRQKPQSPGPVSRPGPKVEKPQVQQKDMKLKPQLESKKSVKKVDETKTRGLPKNGKTTKIKTVASPEEEGPTAVSPAKVVVRKKVTKKSSVVPLEVKPSVRKVSERSPVESQKREIVPSEVEETLSKTEDTQNVVNNVGITQDKIDLVEAQDSETQNSQYVELEIESETGKPENGMESEVSPQGDEVRERMMDSPLKVQIQPSQESVISPTAWIENDQQDETILLPQGENSSSSMANSEGVSSSGIRVRHSLSQMLLEESSEPDVIEWGNAEHPPSMVFQKDAPKGLKRLLKFARKNKEGNGSSWASPYTSEGEEDGDEYRSLGKGKSDNLLKVALHSKNYAEGFLSDNEPLSARSNASNISSRSSNKFQDGHGSSKGARSFFSLSAFRGKN